MCLKLSCTHTTILFFTFSIVFNKLRKMFNLLQKTLCLR